MRRILTIISIILTLYSCGQRSNEDTQDVSEKTQKAFLQKSQMLQSNLNGKSLNRILKDHYKSDYSLILYYSAADCNSCLLKAQEVYFENSISNDWKILGIMKGEAIPRTITKVIDPIYYDSSYQIDDQLGYIPTPSLIKVNSNWQIQDLYIFPIFEDSERLNDFIRK